MAFIIMYEARKIGRYSQGIPGPLLVVFGAMHGNEPAGVNALKTVFYLLEQEKIKKPDFKFRGSIIGIIANLDAYNEKKRYINKDLNRSWSYEAYKLLKEKSPIDFNSEERQIYEVIEVIKEEVLKSMPNKIIVLDLHTTSSQGGIFSLITDDPISEKIAIELHAPVIKGMLHGVRNSSIHFFHGENMGIPTTAIAFECGQHEDPLSPFIGASAVINCLRTIGSVDKKDVENKHDEILLNFSKDLPKVSEYIGKYSIRSNAHFKMLPGFKSFDKVMEGQHLADDINGPVYCQEDAMILMPFYQNLGEDGYFLVKSCG
jgi:succinylglutamate desuccinylase